jgi:hypothetical protein
MGIDPETFRQIEARVAANLRKGSLAKHEAPIPDGGDMVPDGQEGKLHEEIEKWCNAQWPRWKILCARRDKRSTLPVGAHDDTVFGPFPFCLLLELKTKSTKQDKDQLIWAKELEMLGWRVQVIRSMAEFHAAVKNATDGNSSRQG